ncbi:CTR copper uptake transporter [Mycena crocata]|nr:CTR copper uptake transporter [Mycena crocata]
MSLLPPSPSLLPLFLLLLSPLPLLLPAYAAENGMDMTMDDGMTLAMGSMTPYLHFSRPGDTLWFAGWVPQSAGAVAGACVGLFVLALVDRWVAAVRAMMEVHWRGEGERVRRLEEKEKVYGEKGTVGEKGGGVDTAGKKREKRKFGIRAPPFVPAHDVMRGVMHALQATLGFAFMLAVMTFQAAFILAIVLGLGVGEMLFGRYVGAAGMAH